MFHKLIVKRVEKPIADATTIVFDVPEHLYKKFEYQPGQHLIIKFLIEGKEARRSYSLNSCPFNDETLQITVKRVQGGLVSNFVNDNLQAGDELEVMSPQGRFFADIQESDYKTIFLFAAGSGITPIISILKSVLVASPNSAVNLFYGNTDQDSIIFKKELDELLVQYPERLQIVHTLSNPKVWSSWEQWDGRKGRIEPNDVEWFITNHPPVAQSTAYFICGPGAMNVSIKKTLVGMGIPKELVHIEQFGGKSESVNTNIATVDNARLSVSIHGKSHDLIVPKGKTFLEVMKTADIDPPYSCQSGVCATCVAKVTKGSAEMKACMALDETDIAKGMILTCQGIPTSEEVTVVF